MKVGDRVRATRKIKLANGKVFPRGTEGEVTTVPPAEDSVHVLFDGAENPCLVYAHKVGKLLAMAILQRGMLTMQLIKNNTCRLQSLVHLW